MFVSFLKTKKRILAILLEILSLVVGAALTWRYPSLMGSTLYLSLMDNILNPLLLFLLLYDLDFPKLVTGTEIKPLRLFPSFLGPLILATFDFGLAKIIGIFLILLFFTSMVISIEKISAKIDWTSDTRLRRNYYNLLEEELAKDPEILNKRIVIWKRKELSISQFLKAVVLLKTAVEITIFAIILATFIGAIEYTYSISLSMFVLLMVLTLSSFRNLITERSPLKMKFVRIFEIRESIESGIWATFIRSFSTLRGFYYSLLFLPSIMLATASIIMSFQFCSFFIKEPIPETSLDSLLLIPLSFFAFVFIVILIANCIYPFYVTIKLFRVNSLQERNKEKVAILPCPYLCLFASISPFKIALLQQYVPRLHLLAWVTLQDIMVYGIIAIDSVIWIRTFWLKRKGHQEVIDKKMERNLAIIMGIWAIPVYYLIFSSVDTKVIVGFLICWTIVFGILRLLSSSSPKQNKVISALMVLFSILVLYIIFLAPEYLSVAPLIILALSLQFLLLLPSEKFDKMIKILLRIEALDTNSNNH